MDKISCDVTKDLMAAYLDGTCSEESRGLVEEHLRECASCKEFVEQVQEQDLGKDAVKVDFLKRVRKSVNFRLCLGIALPVAAIFIGHPRLQQVWPVSFYYITMPILMLAGALAPIGDGKALGVKKDKINQKDKKEWLIPALGVALVCAALCLQVRSWRMICGEVPLPCAVNEAGAYIERRNTCIAVLAIVLLILSYVRFESRKSGFIIGQNLAWLGMYLVLSGDSLLYHMADYPTVSGHFRESTVVIVSEFVVVTALMLVFCRMGDKRKKRYDNAKISG